VLNDPVGDDGLDDPLDVGIAELGLGLAFELRIRQLHTDDGGKPLPHVVAAEVAVLLREDARPAGPVVQ
jgi:hypothetical protein